jgi:hypothetical protein
MIQEDLKYLICLFSTSKEYQTLSLLNKNWNKITKNPESKNKVIVYYIEKLIIKNEVNEVISNRTTYENLKKRITHLLGMGIYSRLDHDEIEKTILRIVEGMKLNLGSVIILEQNRFMNEIKTIIDYYRYSKYETQLDEFTKNYSKIIQNVHDIHIVHRFLRKNGNGNNFYYKAIVLKYKEDHMIKIESNLCDKNRRWSRTFVRIKFGMENFYEDSFIYFNNETFIFDNYRKFEKINLFLSFSSDLMGFNKIKNVNNYFIN